MNESIKLYLDTGRAPKNISPPSGVADCTFIQGETIDVYNALVEEFLNPDPEDESRYYTLEEVDQAYDDGKEEGRMEMKKEMEILQDAVADLEDENRELREQLANRLPASA